MTLRAILFDHDGTLVDSEPVHFQMWATVLARYGVFLSEEEYRIQYAGIPTQANAVGLVERFDLQQDPAVLATEKNSITRDFLLNDSFPLMPGVAAAISEFQQAGLALAVVTGAGAHGVHSTLRANGFEDRFATIVSGDDVRVSKPAPDCYLLALQRLGIQPDECIAIEDTQHGVAAAYEAGIRCLAVPNRMSKHHNFQRAAAIFDGMSDVISYVRQFMAVVKPNPSIERTSPGKPGAASHVKR